MGHPAPILPHAVLLRRPCLQADRAGADRAAQGLPAEGAELPLDTRQHPPRHHRQPRHRPHQLAPDARLRASARPPLHHPGHAPRHRRLHQRLAARPPARPARRIPRQGRGRIRRIVIAHAGHARAERGRAGRLRQERHGETLVQRHAGTHLRHRGRRRVGDHRERRPALRGARHVEEHPLPLRRKDPQD